MAATTGKGVKTDLNREAMNKNAVPDSIKDYVEKLDKENEIDITEMFMALCRSIKAIEDLNKRPWWKKLFNID